jgi:hypothetical protein
MDRSAIARAIAKAMAHKAAGNHKLAEQWAAHLLYLLDTMDIANQAMLDHYNAGTEPSR